MKQYSIIYADPPWNGLGWNNGSGLKCPANHYPVMEPDEIAKLPVSLITQADCALFLWVTMPNLPTGLYVLESWGFRYATQAFTWVKPTKDGQRWFWGCGNYTRANAELCLLGVKGTMKTKSRSVHSIISSPVEAHSKKPSEVRDRIVQLFGDLPRIELFARQQTPGWDAWGNELNEPAPWGACNEQL